MAIETKHLVNADRLKAVVRAFHEAGEKGLTRQQISAAMGDMGPRAEHRARKALEDAGAEFDDERRDPRTREKIFVMTHPPGWDETISKETRLALRLAAMTLGHGGNSLLERQLETLEKITDKGLTHKDRKVFDSLRSNLKVSGGFKDQPGQGQLSTLEAIFKALSSEIPRQLELTYRPANRPSSTYLFAPYCLSQDLVSGGTYLLGMKVQERAIRLLKVSRMEQIKVTQRPVVILPEQQKALKVAADHLFGGFYSTDPPFQVVMRVEGDWWIQSMKESHPDFPGFTLEEQGQDAILIRFQSNHCIGLVRWILQFGACAEVLEPPELIEAVREEVEALAAAYLKRG